MMSWRDLSSAAESVVEVKETQMHLRKLYEMLMKRVIEDLHLARLKKMQKEEGMKQ